MTAKKKPGITTQQALLGGAAVVAALLFIPRSWTQDADEQNYPYAMTGIRPTVFFAGNRSEDLGEITATYERRTSAVSECQDAASAYAKDKQLGQWNYVCCTITPDSACKTKVK